jgi:hypothetical protein
LTAAVPLPAPVPLDGAGRVCKHNLLTSARDQSAAINRYLVLTRQIWSSVFEGIEDENNEER